RANRHHIALEISGHTGVYSIRPIHKQSEKTRQKSDIIRGAITAPTARFIQIEILVVRCKSVKAHRQQRHQIIIVFGRQKTEKRKVKSKLKHDFQLKIIVSPFNIVIVVLLFLLLFPPSQLEKEVVLHHIFKTSRKGVSLCHLTFPSLIQSRLKSVPITSKLAAKSSSSPYPVDGGSDPPPLPGPSDIASQASKTGSRKQRPSPPVSWPRRRGTRATSAFINHFDPIQVAEDMANIRHDALGSQSQASVETDAGVGSASASLTSLLDYNQDHARVESWLDENPDFFQDYLIRKGGRQMIDAWLVAHALPPGITTSIHNNYSNSEPSSSTDTSPHDDDRDSQNSTRTVSCGSKGSSSGNGTPVRKISAHEFERGGLSKPLVMTIDGTHTFLSPPSSCEVSGQIRKRSRHDVQGLNETELIFELVKDICNDLDVRRLCHKILQNVGILTYADRCSLFLVQGDADQDSRYLVSNLFDVSSNSTVEEMNKKTEIRVPWGQGVVGYVAQSGIPLNISDVYKDERFNQDVDKMTGYRTKSMLCNPIKDTNGDVIGVAQVINKAFDGTFNQNDEALFDKYLQFCGIGLRNAQLYERSQLEVKRNQVLLDLAGVIFQEQSTIDMLIFRILTHMISLIRCERAMLMLVHDNSHRSFSRVFDLEASDMDNEDIKWPFEGRFPINAGITGFVAATGSTVNIADAYHDERFDQAVDANLKFKHKTILCMPICHIGTTRKVLGVFQLVNKFDELPFTKNDENFVEAFAIFCGMGINNVRMYEKAVVAMAKQQVTLEVLSYHASAPLEDGIRLARQKIPSTAALKLNSFSFDDFSLEDDETLQAALRMFIDLDFPGRFHIDYTVLCRWLVSVKKNYRDVTYHNWRHAFNVAQSMFAVITSTQWWKKLGEVECLSLMIACLCHDLDHRGTNNSFQIKSSSNLAQLYSTSTMEHHHFDQCLMILNSKGNQILSNLSQDEFKRVISVLEDSILATDLAVYFRRRNETFGLVDSKELDWSSDNHRSLLRGLMMTAADLAAITKPWPIQKKVARLVSAEFFYQGDLEKKQLNVQPIDMMNREKLDRLPAMQVDFIDTICLPVYNSFAKISPTLSPLREGCFQNRVEWAKLAEKEEKGPKKDP
ncbi:hypothetical protein TCAL_00771, partial [Tigriopus californicus]